MTWQQKSFVAWVAPRGIVSASVASLFAILLTNRGINGGDAIKALVFLTILMTVFIQAPTAGLLAHWLRITSSEATGAVIIGCNPLSCLIGKLFEQQGESVVLIDTDSQACAKARAENLTVYQSSGLDPQILTEAGIESLGTFLALTHNSEVNFLLARHALEEFNPPRVFAAFIDQSPSSVPKKLSAAFLPQLPLKTWNQYLENGQVKLGKTHLTPEKLELKQNHLASLINQGKLLPLLWRRDKLLQIARDPQEWQSGDEIIYLFYDPRPKLLKRLSGSNQPSPLTPEKLAEVEELPTVDQLE